MQVLESMVRGVGFEPTDLYGRDLKSRAFGQLGYPRAHDRIADLPYINRMPGASSPWRSFDADILVLAIRRPDDVQDPVGRHGGEGH